MTLAEKWLGAKAGGERGEGDHPLNGAKGMGRMGADFWPVLKDQRGVGAHRRVRTLPRGRVGAALARQLRHGAARAGARGALATARSEALRECVQAMEARVAIERALLDTERAAALGVELAGRCRRAIDNRRRAPGTEGISSAGSDWSRRDGLLYDLAGEVAAKIAQSEGGRP